MLIKYTKENAGILNVPHPKTAEEKKQSAERAAHSSPKFTSIVPGINEIPDIVWNKIKTNERVQAYLKRKDLVLLHTEQVEDKKASSEKEKVYKDLTVKEFKNLTVAEQEDIIKDTELLPLLKKFKKDAKEGAMALLNDRIDRLSHPEKYVDSDGE